MSARDMLNKGNRWTDIATRLAFPIVIRRALNGQPIEYGELADKLAANGRSGNISIQYRFVAGKIGDICQEISNEIGDAVPPLNAIMINKETRLPSGGIDYYLEKFLGKRRGHISRLSSNARDAYARQAMESVFNFDRWQIVANHLGIKLEGETEAKEKTQNTIALPNPNKFSRGQESESHKSLKIWVAKNPKFFKEYGNFKDGNVEKMISSGDRLDVLFKNRERYLGIEVKVLSSHESEVMRGIYQCIKYRYVLRAMQLSKGTPPNADAILVLDGPPPRPVSQIANRLQVVILVAPNNFRKGRN